MLIEEKQFIFDPKLKPGTLIQVKGHSVDGDDISGIYFVNRYDKKMLTIVNYFGNKIDLPSYLFEDAHIDGEDHIATIKIVEV